MVHHMGLAVLWAQHHAVQTQMGMSSDSWEQKMDGSNLHMVELPSKSKIT